VDQGRPAISRLIDAFYDRIERDDLLSPLFPGGVSAAHREHVTTWWCQVLGGRPTTPSGSAVPGHACAPPRPGHHAGQQFRFGSLTSLAADDADLPGDPEFRDVRRLPGVGTWLAMHNSQPGADIVQQAPMPRWDWGVAPLYQP
jgi:hemoglobin